MPAVSAIRPSTLSKVAVIPVEAHGGAAEVALVRKGPGRWGLIEGWAINGADELDAARLVALEHGLDGQVDAVPIGAYLSWASGRDPALACLVNVFVMHATRAAGYGRECEWMEVDKASVLVGDSPTAPLLRMAGSLVLAGNEGAPHAGLAA